MRKPKRLLTLFLAVLILFSVFPLDVFAWSYMSHTNSANIIRMELMQSNSQSLNLTVQLLNSTDYGFSEYNCMIPEEFYAAIINFPDAFRAGALGPDFYPDMLIGQMYIHPYDYSARVGSGDWLRCLSNPRTGCRREAPHVRKHLLSRSALCSTTAEICSAMTLSTPSPAVRSRPFTM